MNRKKIFSIVMIVISLGIAMFTWYYVESVYDEMDKEMESQDTDE
jgi:hypothetical protein